MNRTLVFHLRYYAGEYKHETSICQSGEWVCIGRQHIRAMRMEDFAANMKYFASSMNCSFIFPIVPNMFTSPKFRKSLARAFGLELSDLISSRLRDNFMVLMVERTLAVQARVLVDEVNSTFSKSLGLFRRAAKLDDFTPLYDTFQKLPEGHARFRLLSEIKQSEDGQVPERALQGGEKNMTT